MFERLELTDTNAMPGKRHHGRARGQCAGVRMDWRGVYWVCVHVQRQHRAGVLEADAAGGLSPAPECDAAAHLCID